MLARVHSSVTFGVDVIPVAVEVEVGAGLPGFAVVGLPDRAVRESLVRVRSALRNSGFRFPRRKVTVNLAPAGIPKEGPVFDLPIALGILAASGQLEEDLLGRRMVVGELALNGAVCATRGVLPRVIKLVKEEGWSAVVPEANLAEALSVEDVPILGASSLTDAIAGLNGERDGATAIPQVMKSGALKPPAFDFQDVRGQNEAKRGLLVAAAGGHNVLLVGPPGVGKSLLAHCFPGILSPMTRGEMLETSQIHSVAGLLTAGACLVEERPFRAPHHSSSPAALVGGGTGIPSPGEVSLAHNGVLLLDELPEFRRDVLEYLRQPLEEGEIRIARSRGQFTFPARFMLVAAMNPCPCGFYGTDKDCVCSDREVHRYRNRISGPLLDRIDIHIDVPRIKVSNMTEGARGETSRELRERVCRSHLLQAERYRGLHHGTRLNAHLGLKAVETFCQPDASALSLLRRAMSELGLSARAWHRILKVARTIADLEEEKEIHAPHIAEAIGYRLFDRELKP
ncbi:MAG: YifB family Mg chelatase-like AAA ATPase [Candidatus Omnitrophica bacterium]|nr:YifB family Mg chelatase-like AAA ATPase [Candidatus Omnitrophota bacterium]